jgi:N-acetylmuramoyl-L-alanine amidase
MTKKVWIDEGHGGSDSGACANGLQEADLVVKIARYTHDHLLNNYEDVEVRTTRGFKDLTVLLERRDDLADAWGADAFVSIHINAGKGTGFESFVFTKAGPSTKAFQNVVHDEIMKTMNKRGLRDRGKKQANFSVLRETEMIALLNEFLFIDSDDHKHLKDEGFLKECGIAQAVGIAKALGLKAKPKPVPKPSGELYKVQIGAFSLKANAEKVAKEAKSKGFNAYIVKER